MAIDPDVQPLIDGLQAQIDALRNTVSQHAQHFDTTGAHINALAGADKALERQLADVVARVAKLEQTAPSWSPRFPGDVKPGTIRWGSSRQANGDPTQRHEVPAGRPLGVRRTFWSMSKVSGMVTTCSADIAAGRVPWVSAKLGVSWATVAAGGIDAQLRAAFVQLGELPGPVWFTAHHEPENDPADGTAADWRAMQARVRQVLDASGVTNVAFAPVLMSWTFDPRSGRTPADWHVDGIWDFAGVDHYKDRPDGDMASHAGWPNAERFYTDRGLRIAVGEWGNRGTDTTAADQMSSWYEHLLSIGSPGASYFDSGLNSPSGSWELAGEQLSRFHQLMSDPRSVTLKETP